MKTLTLVAIVIVLTIIQTAICSFVLWMAWNIISNKFNLPSISFSEMGIIYLGVNTALTCKLKVNKKT
jgi:DNA-binding transcriptional regulator of glucitol operon